MWGHVCVYVGERESVIERDGKREREVLSFICACIRAGILLASILAGLVSAGLSIGQVDL